MTLPPGPADARKLACGTPCVCWSDEVAGFNINNIRKRLPNLRDWSDETRGLTMDGWRQPHAHRRTSGSTSRSFFRHSAELT
jgi:hypothetical protein